MAWMTSSRGLRSTMPRSIISKRSMKVTRGPARCFGAMKGAADAGLHVPHTTKRFPGYEPPAEKGADPNYEAETHKARILGGHVGEYMEMLEEEDPTKYEAH